MNIISRFLNIMAVNFIIHFSDKLCVLLNLFGICICMMKLIRISFIIHDSDKDFYTCTMQFRANQIYN